MSKFVSKCVHYSTVVSSPAKDLLPVILFFLVFFFCCSNSFAYTSLKKSEYPSWARQKINVSFNNVNIQTVLSAMVPSGKNFKIDEYSNKVRITAKGNLSILDVLNLNKEKVDFSFDDDTLVVSGFVVRNYQIPYLAMKYSVTQSYNSSGSYYVTTNTTGSSSGGTNISGSSSSSEKSASIENKLQIDFWEEIKKEIQEILGIDGKVSSSKKTTSTTSKKPEPETIQEMLKKATPTDSTFAQKMPDTVVTEEPQKAFVVINRASGLITVGGPVDRIRVVDKYIEQVRKKVNESIEVEFTMIELQERNDLTTGITWQMVLRANLFERKRYFLSKEDEQAISLMTTGMEMDKTKGAFSFGVSAGDRQKIILDLLKEVANIRVITKTNFLLKNNTSVGFNTGILTSFIDSLEGSSTETAVTYTITKGQVLSGIDLVISASVEGDNITLNLIPTISKLTNLETMSFGQDLLVQNPTIEAKKSIATVTVKDGETTAVVGYNLSTKGSERQGIPLLSDIPIIGLLFSKQVITDEKAYIVMLITPKIKRID